MNIGTKQLIKILVVPALITMAFGAKEFFFDPQIKELGNEWVSFPADGTFILYSYSINGFVQNVYLRSEEEMMEYRTYLDRIGRFTIDKKTAKK